MAVTHFNAGDPFGKDVNGDYLWKDNFNWDNGTPQYGEWVVIDGSNIPAANPNNLYPTITLGDLGLSGLTLACTNIELTANFLTLSHTSVTASSGGQAFGGVAVLRANQVMVGRGSFVGVAANQRNCTLILDVAAATNYGTVGAQGGSCLLTSNQPDPNAYATVYNNGHIVAAGGGQTTLVHQYVTGTGNLIISQGGVLDLVQSDVAEDLSMGGASATTFEFDPSISSFYGKIHSFSVTDFIHLDNFQLIGLSQSGTVDPVLSLSGTDGGNNIAFNLNFSGNFATKFFYITPDTSGSGTLLYVSHVPPWGSLRFCRLRRVRVRARVRQHRNSIIDVRR